VAVDPRTGDVYVADTGNYRVEKFGAYVTERTDNLSLPNNAEEGESVTCPAGTVVLSGGARINSFSVKAGINSSYPS
jgi:NHL repeat